MADADLQIRFGADASALRSGLGAVKSALDSLTSGLAGIQASFTSLAGSISQQAAAMGQLSAAMQAAATQARQSEDAWSGAGKSLDGLFKTIEDVNAMVEFSKNIAKLTEQLGLLPASAGAAATGLAAVDAAADANPIGLLVLAIEAIVVAITAAVPWLVHLYEKNADVHRIVDAVVIKVKDFIEALGHLLVILGEAARAIGDFVSMAADILTLNIGSILTTWRDRITDVKGAFHDAAGAARGFWNAVTGKGAADAEAAEVRLKQLSDALAKLSHPPTKAKPGGGGGGHGGGWSPGAYHGGGGGGVAPQASPASPPQTSSSTADDEDRQRQEQAAKEKQIALDLAQFQEQQTKAAASAEAASENGQLAMKREALAADVALHRISAEQEFDTQRSLAAEETATQRKQAEDSYEIANNALLAKLALAAGEPVEAARLRNQITLLYQEHQDKLTAIDRKGALERQKIDDTELEQTQRKWEQTIGPIVSTFTSGLQKMIGGSMSFSRFMLSIGQSILQSWVANINKMVTHWAAGMLAQVTAKRVATIQIVGLESDAGTNILAIQGATSLKSIVNSAATAAGSAYSALAGIPFIGPELGAAAAVATFASVVALKALVASAAGGYDVPAGVNPVTQLHAEEMVLPARIANPMRDMVSRFSAMNANGATPANDGAGATATHLHLHMGAGADGPSLQRWFDQHGDKIAKSLGVQTCRAERAASAAGPSMASVRQNSVAGLGAAAPVLATAGAVAPLVRLAAAAAARAESGAGALAVAVAAVTVAARPVAVRPPSTATAALGAIITPAPVGARGPPRALACPA